MAEENVACTFNAEHEMLTCFATTDHTIHMISQDPTNWQSHRGIRVRCSRSRLREDRSRMQTARADMQGIGEMTKLTLRCGRSRLDRILGGDPYVGLSYSFIIQLELGVGVDGRRSNWIPLQLGGYTLWLVMDIDRYTSCTSFDVGNNAEHDDFH